MKITVDFNVNDDASVEAFTGWVNGCPWALTEPAILVDTTPEAIVSGGIEESGLQALAGNEPGGVTFVSQEQIDAIILAKDVSGDLSGDINGELSVSAPEGDEISKEAQEAHELEKQESQDQAA